jgi:hypothetical protein
MSNEQKINAMMDGTNIHGKWRMMMPRISKFPPVEGE